MFVQYEFQELFLSTTLIDNNKALSIHNEQLWKDITIIVIDIERDYNNRHGKP